MAEDLVGYDLNLNQSLFLKTQISIYKKHLLKRQNFTVMTTIIFATALTLVSGTIVFCGWYFNHPARQEYSGQDGEIRRLRAEIISSLSTKDELRLKNLLQEKRNEEFMN